MRRSSTRIVEIGSDVVLHGISHATADHWFRIAADR